MTNVVLLDNIEHGNLKVGGERGEAFDDHVNQVLVFPNEFRALQREYPIVFRRDASGDFQSVALLGLERDENLFLSNGVWHAGYMPAVQARGPFSIGLKKPVAGAQEEASPVIRIDLDNPAVGTEEGHPLFLPQGGYSPYLEGIMEVLKTLHTGVAFSKAFFIALEELDLIEPATLEIKISDSQQYSVPDVFSINEQRFQNLHGNDLEKLHLAGLLAPCVWVMSSLDNIRSLVERKLQADDA